jgi:hypothetical protein
MTFARIKALGWAMFEVLTSAQMTQLDIDHAKATDSTYVKDYGAACFIPTKILSATWANKDALVYLPNQGNWLGVGQSQATRSAGGFTVRAATTFPAGWTSPPRANAIAHDGNLVVVAGSSESAASVANWRRTTDYITWTKQNQVSPIASIITCVGWWAAKSLFVAGFGGASPGPIETSPDGITWTLRTVPDSIGRNAVAFNNSIAVMVSGGSGVSTDAFCQTSTDGITWTNRAMPANKAWVGVDYSTIDGVFLAMADDGTVAKSADGITWTAVTSSYAAMLFPAGSAPFYFGSITNLKCINNLWLAPINAGGSFFVGVMCSFDLGATWRPLVEVSSGVTGFGVYGGQVAIAESAAIYFSNKLSLS